MRVFSSFMLFYPMASCKLYRCRHFSCCFFDRTDWYNEGPIGQTCIRFRQPQPQIQILSTDFPLTWKSLSVISYCMSITILYFVFINFLIFCNPWTFLLYFCTENIVYGQFQLKYNLHFIENCKHYFTVTEQNIDLCEIFNGDQINKCWGILYPHHRWIKKCF